MYADTGMEYSLILMPHTFNCHFFFHTKDLEACSLKSMNIKDYSEQDVQIDLHILYIT